MRLPPWITLVVMAGLFVFSARRLAATFRSVEFEWLGLLAWGGTAATKIGIHTMQARGPLFNAAAALLMLVSGSSHYWIFQIIAITFNSLICSPFALILESVSGLSRRRALPISAGVCLLVPFFFRNNTYSWTKDRTAALRADRHSRVPDSLSQGRWRGDGKIASLVRGRVPQPLPRAARSAHRAVVRFFVLHVWHSGRTRSQRILGYSGIVAFQMAIVGWLLLRAGASYYRNYVYKITGGAVYLRDLHLESFATVSWALFAAGVFALTGLSWRRFRRSN
jgi:hypothetical protein